MRLISSSFLSKTDGLGLIRVSRMCYQIVLYSLQISLAELGAYILQRGMLVFFKKTLPLNNGIL